MEQEKFAKVVRIPRSGHRMTVVKLPLSETDRLGDPTDESQRSENNLKHVPDLLEYTYWQLHAWKYRSLVDLGSLDMEQSTEEAQKHHGPYFMCKCSTESQNYGRNKRFKKIEGAAGVYGSAFIFKVKEPATFDEQGMIEYEDLDENFIRDAFEGKGLADVESLKWLANK